MPNMTSIRQKHCVKKRSDVMNGFRDKQIGLSLSYYNANGVALNIMPFEQQTDQSENI